MTNEKAIEILETIKNVYFLPMEEEGQALIKAIEALKREADNEK